MKTTNADSVVWSRKKSGETFLDRRPRGDYCCVVDLQRGVAGARIYLVPTGVVQAAIDEGREYWNSGRKRDGGKRVDSTGQRLWLNERLDRHTYEGFRIKWEKYLGNWSPLRA